MGKSNVLNLSEKRQVSSSGQYLSYLSSKKRRGWMDLRGSLLNEVTITSSKGARVFTFAFAPARLTIRNMIGRLCLRNECEMASRIATWGLAIVTLVKTVFDNSLEATIFVGKGCQWRGLIRRVSIQV